MYACIVYVISLSYGIMNSIYLCNIPYEFHKKYTDSMWVQATYNHDDHFDLLRH